jgi:hypothetical protein
MALNGGSSAVSCSETPPLQPSRPLKLCRMKQDGEDVQPANESAGTLRILAASSGDWTVDGGKNSIYAPSPFSHSHLPIPLSPGARRPPRCERDEQTLSEQASSVSQILTSRQGQWCVEEGLALLKPPPFALPLEFGSSAMGAARVESGTARTERKEHRSPAVSAAVQTTTTRYIDKVHRYSTDHDVGSVMGCRDQQAIPHCFCSRCARAAVVRPLFAES